MRYCDPGTTIGVLGISSPGGRAIYDCYSGSAGLEVLFKDDRSIKSAQRRYE